MFNLPLKSLSNLIEEWKVAPKKKTREYEIVTSTVADVDHVSKSEITDETIIKNTDIVVLIVGFKFNIDIDPKEGMTVRTLVERISN